MDAGDSLRAFRDAFHLPARKNGKPLVYFCGHSLGLAPRDANRFLEQELQTWANLGVKGHFEGPTPWYTYHEVLRDSGARLVGAKPDEVVFMNGLTVNLHLLFATFYRPTPRRFRILYDEPTFPSDLYALQSQARHHRLDPARTLLPFRPRGNQLLLRGEDFDELLARFGSQVAVVWLAGVNFLSGQRIDVPRLAEVAHQHGCLFGLDLAHAIGNVPLALHDWDVDFGVWCSYKYLNGGPGAPGGCFIHERHARQTCLPRLAGWWGNDPATRFQMQLLPEFIARPSADGWQLSNPPILAMAPLRASLALFDQATLPALRAKSERLTHYLEALLDRLSPERFEVITPRDPGRRGCQLSLVVRDRPKAVWEALQGEGILCDFREPNVLRIAPVPLYNTFHEVWTMVQVLARF
jgi:kynureninase